MNNRLWKKADAVAVKKGYSPAFTPYSLHQTCGEVEFNARMDILEKVIRKDERRKILSKITRDMNPLP